ncbi:MAG: YggS family pyridoxal phosphate-dependent enzyme [Bacteroidetes bacterium]|nr:YggS family pyridoxal phosphate-dependent enzyme [Bacteroidota bacterium]
MPGYAHIAPALARVQAGIAEACLAAGRSPNEVTLVAVSKTYPPEAVAAAAAAGQLHFGENRVQEYQQKQPLQPQAHWHLIGSLQTNKVKYIAPSVYLIHSLDSRKLAEEINRRAEQVNRTLDCLIQVNISAETQKGGVAPETVADFIATLQDLPHLRICGLMGMAEFTEDLRRIAGQFRHLRKLFDTLGAHATDRVQMQTLSMGMSGDYAVAIAEGSTLVRVGSAIFGTRT